MIPNFATYDRLGLKVQELETFGKCLEPYFSKLADEEGLYQLFRAQIR